MGYTRPVITVTTGMATSAMCTTIEVEVNEEEDKRKEEDNKVCADEGSGRTRLPRHGCLCVMSGTSCHAWRTRG
jgi:hypothetical protein